MDAVLPLMSPLTLILGAGIALCAGFVKGVVGFALPLVLISGLTLFLPPEVALAGLILPSLATNMFQALRQGLSAAWRSIKAFRVFLIAGGITLVGAAQLVRMVPETALQFGIGLVAASYAVLQLAGLSLQFSRHRTWVEGLFGTVAGVMGGFTGVWAPPTVIYLTALGTPKLDQIRVQGVIYGLGSVALVVAHVGSGVLNAETAPFSVALILPALIGMWLGGRVVARIDQRMFKRATLVVLLIAGANLIRRSLV